LNRAVFINDNNGTIIGVSKDKTNIKILLSKGGIVKARNEGFEKGDNVCFILNATKTKIIKVIPKLVADVTAIIGSDPILRAATEEQPDDLEQDFDEYEFYDEEITIEEEREENNESRGKITREGNERTREAEFIISDSS